MKLAFITSILLGFEIPQFYLVAGLLGIFLLLNGLKRHKSDIRPWEKEEINTVEDWHKNEL